MTDVEQGPPSPTQNEVLAVQESQAVEKSKKRKHDGNTHTTLVDRPRRQVHPVIPYSQMAEAKSRTRKPVEVVQGEGFVLGTPIDEMVFKEKLEKWKISGLKDISLMTPPVLKIENQKNAKNKKTSTSKTSKKSATVRKKTPKDIFFIKQREIFKAKEGNESASRSEVEKQMTEAWNDLSEKEKKPYISLAENAN
ncbi:5412_t:CDS:2, partial [Acaulospora morrowiae]